jgi:hypothetical protein
VASLDLPLKQRTASLQALPKVDAFKDGLNRRVAKTVAKE